MGVGLRKKPKDLSVSEREECEHGEGVDVKNTVGSGRFKKCFGRIGFRLL